MGEQDDVDEGRVITDALRESDRYQWEQDQREEAGPMGESCDIYFFLETME